MSEMNGEKARRLLDAHKAGDVVHWTEPRYYEGLNKGFVPYETWKVDFLKGYLAALEGPEVRELVEALELDQRLEKFDCPHEAEQLCECGKVEARLFGEYRQKRNQALPKFHSLTRSTKEGKDQ